MPLVIITGYPSSGKSHRARQILADFEDRVVADVPTDTHKQQRSVTILPSHHAASDPPIIGEHANATPRPAPLQALNPRDQIYNSSSREKTARAEEFSAIKRALSKNHVVIADGLNYIKGLRYQLWCEAKAAGTRCVVVHAAAREDECTRWNDARLEAWGWENDANVYCHENIQGPMVGRDVIGNLEPESHTAIYGDRIVEYNSATRSRSSSMDGGAEEGANSDEEAKHGNGNSKADNLTLNSLYISENQADSSSPSALPTANEREQEKEHQTEHISKANSPSSQPPPPISSLPYSTSTLKSLIMRYEPPSPFTRWDTPLFTIPTADIHPPYESIWNAIFPAPTKSTSKKALSQQSHSTPNNTSNESEGKVEAVRQHAATMLPQATSSEALQILESSTAEVVKRLLTAAREQGMANGEGGQLAFLIPTTATATAGGVGSADANANAQNDKSTEIPVSIHLPLNTPISQPMLQRLRRKYTQIQRGSIAHGRGYASGREEVVSTFVGFLAAEWGD